MLDTSQAYARRREMTSLALRMRCRSDVDGTPDAAVVVVDDDDDSRRATVLVAAVAVDKTDMVTRA